MPLLALSYPSWLSPEIISGLPFRWYGLMYLFAFGTAYFMVLRQIKIDGLSITKDETTNLFFWAIIGLLIGARILATIVYDTSGRYFRNPLLIFWPFDEHFRFTGLQGMSYHGGVIGATAAIIIYCRVKKYDVLLWGDLVVTAIPLGYTFGRLGNFINGELYGRVTTAAWGMIFPHAEKFSAKESWVRETAAAAGIPIADPSAMVNLPRHPSQLYEAFFEGIFLWAVLWFFLRPRKPYKGYLIGAYMAGYGIVRFFIEYFREPDRDIGFPLRFSSLDNPLHLLVTPWNFTTGQILCMLMIAAGIVTNFALKRKAEKKTAGQEVPDGKKGLSRRMRKKLR